MILLQANLLIPRCPHCNVDQPNLAQKLALQTADHSNGTSDYGKFTNVQDAAD